MRKPLTGTILGIVFGWAVAIILQQLGIWPLDKLTVWFLPALLGLLFLLILSIGKEGAMGTFVLSMVILIPMAVWGAIGIGSANEQGQLSGGCMVAAESSVPDTTNVIDTSKQDPFAIDPQGSLIWAATSPVAFDDYPWEIWVEIGGVRVPVDSEDSEDNDGGSLEHGGNIPNVEQYAAERGIDIAAMTGVHKVGGHADNTCVGFGFVKLTADPFSTLAAQVALAVAIVMLLFLILILILSRGSGAAAAAATATAAGAADENAGATDSDGGSASGDDPGTAENIGDDIATGAVAAGYGRHSAEATPDEEAPAVDSDATDQEDA